MPPDEALSGFDLPREEIARRFDLVMIGDRGKLLFSRGRTEWLTAPGELLEEFEAPEPTIPRVANEDAEWIEACKGGPAALSNFDYSGPLTEFVLLGNLAIRLGRPLSWDSEAMRCPDAPEADPLIRREYREGWEA
jgi:hypothetical protein